MAQKKKKKKKKESPKTKETRRRYTDEFKDEAVQMMLDGLTAASVKERLGLPNVNLLYRWKQERLHRSGPVVSSLETRVCQLENELRRVHRECEILKRALAIFGHSE